MNEHNEQQIEAVLRQSRGLDAFRATLLPTPENSSFGVIGTDLDDTVKEIEKVEWSDGKKRRVYPETVAALRALHDVGIAITPITEQALSEIRPWIQDVTQLSGVKGALVKGVIGEGGCVAERGTGKKAGEVVVLARKEERGNSRRVLDWMHQNIEPATDDELRKEGWGILKGVDPEQGTYVMLPDEDDQGLVSVSLWKRGPRISADPSYIQRYALVDQRIQEAMEKELQIFNLVAREAGNGTGRVMPTHIDKARTMMMLAGRQAYDPKRMGYFCDGPNDVRFAEKLKGEGGFVITVKNGVNRLQQIADYSASQPAGRGIAEAVRVMFPEQYNQAMMDLHQRNLFAVG